MVHDPTKYNKSDYYLAINNLKSQGVEVDWTDEMIEEFRRCSEDINYFAENYVKIITLDHGLRLIKPVDFQKKIWKIYNENRFVIHLASRQSFKTTTAAIFILHQVVFRPDLNIVIVANKAITSRKILHRIKEMYRYLPMWMQPGVREWNKGNILCENNSMITAVAASAATGRGESANIVYLDEFAFVQNDTEIVTSMFPVISAGKDTKIIITSTMNGVANEFYKFWKKAINGENEFVPIEVKWSDVPMYDENFKEQMIANIGKQRWLQEYENEALSSSSTLIDLHLLADIETRQPLNEDWQRTSFRVYEYPQEGGSYIISVDVSMGKGQDYSTIQVLKESEGCYRQVAVYENNEIQPSDFVEKIYEVATMYNDAFCIVESNGPGHLVCYKLFFEKNYRSMWLSGTRSHDDIGLKTTVSVKNKGCLLLADMIENGKLEIVDSFTVKQLMAFERKGSSYGAATGHDDLVMPLVLASYCISEGVTTVSDPEGGFSVVEWPDSFVVGDDENEDIRWLLS